MKKKNRINLHLHMRCQTEKFSLMWVMINFCQFKYLFDYEIRSSMFNQQQSCKTKWMLRSIWAQIKERNQYNVEYAFKTKKKQKKRTWIDKMIVVFLINSFLIGKRNNNDLRFLFFLFLWLLHNGFVSKKRLTYPLPRFSIGTCYRRSGIL